MGTFPASLRAIGETTPLPATVQVGEGQLSISAGSTEIGTWALADIELEPIPTGYRMSAEGEQIVIELKDIDGFSEAIASGRFKRRRGVRGKEKTSAPTAQPANASMATDGPTVTHPRSVAGETGTITRPSSDEGIVAKGLELLDIGIEKARKRFGPYMPAWIFSRAMAFILFGVFVIMLIFPNVSSVLLLLLGGGAIALGAVAYSDPMLASKVLPGRMQPPHILIAGVAVLVLGVLIGVIFG